MGRWSVPFAFEAGGFLVVDEVRFGDRPTPQITNLYFLATSQLRKSSRFQRLTSITLAVASKGDLVGTNSAKRSSQKVLS